MQVTTGERKDTDDVAGAARAAVDPAASDPAARELDDPDEAEAGDAQAEAEPDRPAPDDATRSPDDAPPIVRELSAACVRFVGARYGVLLDFSPETLSFVDQWVRDARAELTRRPEVAELVQGAAGAYLGEVIRRAFGATWLLPEDGAADLPGWRLGLATVYCSFNPIGMVREALLLAPADGWQAHFELDPGEREEIEQRLAALPAVEDDEFFAPSTRFDVVWILVDALHAGMQARGLGSVVFSGDDYPGDSR